MKPLLEEQTEASLTFPKFSVIIINFNGGSLLENCLNSLLETDYPSFEVILFDNNSHDGSLQNTATVFGGNEKVSIITSKENMGFSAANEIASKVATGEYLIFLNNDTVVDKKWLLEILRVFEEESVGICQSKLVSLTNKAILDSAGDFPTKHGIPFIRGYNFKDMWHKPDEIFSARGAALCIKRKLFEQIGGMDKDFFVGWEDVDLSWRARLAGYKVMLAPDSIVFHYGGLASYRISHVVAFHKHKNTIATAIKNYDKQNLLRNLPLLLSMRFMFSLAPFNESRKTFGSGEDFLKALIWIFRNLRPIIQKRMRVQNYIRRVSDKEALRLMPGFRFELQLLLSLFRSRGGKSMWTSTNSAFTRYFSEKSIGKIHSGAS